MSQSEGELSPAPVEEGGNADEPEPEAMEVDPTDHENSAEDSDVHIDILDIKKEVLDAHQVDLSQDEDLDGSGEQVNEADGTMADDDANENIKKCKVSLERLTPKQIRKAIKREKNLSTRISKYCFVPGCRPRQKFTSHRFPSHDLNMVKKWVVACRGKNAPLNLSWNHHRVCARHFKEDDYERNLRNELLGIKDAKKKLLPHAVPSLNLGQFGVVPKGPSKTEARRKERERKALVQQILEDDQKEQLSAQINKEKMLNTLNPVPIKEITKSSTFSSNPNSILLINHSRKAVQDEISQLSNFIDRRATLLDVELKLPGLESELKKEKAWLAQRLTDLVKKSEEEDPESQNEEPKGTKSPGTELKYRYKPQNRFKKEVTENKKKEGEEPKDPEKPVELPGVIKLSMEKTDGTICESQLTVSSDEKKLIQSQQIKIKNMEERLVSMKAQKTVLDVIKANEKNHQVKDAKDFLIKKAWRETEARLRHEYEMKTVQQEHRRLKVKNRELEKKLKQATDPEFLEKQFKKMLKERTSLAQCKFLLGQDLDPNSKTHFTDDEIKNAILLRRISTQAYDFLRIKKMMPLPTRSCLGTWRQKLNLNTPESLAFIRELEDEKARKLIPDPMLPKPSKPKPVVKTVVKKVVKIKKVRVSGKKKTAPKSPKGKAPVSPTSRKQKTDSPMKKAARGKKAKANKVQQQQQQQQQQEQQIQIQQVQYQHPQQTLFYEAEVPTSHTETTNAIRSIIEEPVQEHQDVMYEFTAEAGQTLTQGQQYVKVGNTFILLRQ